MNTFSPMLRSWQYMAAMTDMDNNYLWLCHVYISPMGIIMDKLIMR